MRYAIIALGNAAIAQSVVRRIGSAEVTGSIPVSSLKRNGESHSFFGLRAMGAL